MGEVIPVDDLDAFKKEDEEKQKALDQWPDESQFPTPKDGMEWVRKRNPYWQGDGWDKWTYYQAPMGTQLDNRALVPKEDPGSLLGDVFQWAGYKWLGPGTDIKYNSINDVQPINDLDSVARDHDYAYNRIGNDLKYGVIDYDEAVLQVYAADADFIRETGKLPGLSSYLSSLGMSSKHLYDMILRGASYAGISPEMYKSAVLGTYEKPFAVRFSQEGFPDYGKYLEYMESDPSYAAYIASRAGVTQYDGKRYRMFYDSLIGGRWYDPTGYYDKLTEKRRMKYEIEKNARLVKRNQSKPSGEPISRIIAAVDSNNNGIPDVMEEQPSRRTRFKRKRTSRRQLRRNGF